MPRKREPRFVRLAPGQSTELELTLETVFRSLLGVGTYQITIDPDEGPNVVKEFEVYFDAEKSVAILGQRLKSDDTERLWSVANLVKFSRPQLVALLEDTNRWTSPRREFLPPLDSRSLANDDEVVGLDIGDLLRQPIWPTDSQIGDLGVAKAEVQAPVVR